MKLLSKAIGASIVAACSIGLGHTETLQQNATIKAGNTGCFFGAWTLASVTGDPETVTYVCPGLSVGKDVRVTVTNLQVCDWRQDTSEVTAGSRTVKVHAFVVRGRNSNKKDNEKDNDFEMPANHACTSDFKLNLPPFRVGAVGPQNTQGHFAISLSLADCGQDQIDGQKIPTTCTVHWDTLQILQ